jgi:hypothetical protein
MNNATEISCMQQSSRLAWDIRQLFVHTCDIYQREAIAAEADGDPEAKDAAYENVAVATGVACFFESTPEFDEAKPEGLSKEVNVLTSDRWYFLPTQAIEDTWLIVMKTQYPGGRRHPDYGKCWQVQGNAQTCDMPGTELNTLMVYAKLAPDETILV